MSQVTFLETCSALPAPAEGAAPAWVMLIPAGISKGVDGRGPYNNDKPDAVVAASIQGNRPLPFDYNHQSIFAAKMGQSSPASGWIDKLEVRDGAIWGHVDWTEAGGAAVASREYRYVSPAFRQDKQGRVTQLVSVGLVNSPNLAELPAINAQLSSHSANGETMTEEEMAALRAPLGLPADATAAAIVAHAAQHKGTLVTGAPDPKLFVPMSVFAEMQATVATLTENAATKRAQELVALGTQQGKVTPAMGDWALSYASRDPDDFATYLEKAPVIIAPGTDPKLANVDATISTHASGLTAAELTVAANFGLTPEAYKAAKKDA